MSIPYVTESVTDGSLGTVAGDATKVLAILGYASALTANTVYPYTQPTDLVSAAGYGAGVELAAQVLARGEGKVTVLLVKPTTSAGSISLVTLTGTGLATVADSSSAPNDRYDVVIKIGKAGAVATATFQYSLDGGETYNGKEIASAATYAIPNTGITIAMSDSGGPFVLGDLYAFTATGPTFTTTQMGTAFDALAASGRDFSMVHVVSTPADTSALAAMAAALDTKLAGLVTTYVKYACGSVEGPSGVADATVISGIASTTSNGGRVSAFADFCRLTSAVSSRREKRPAAWPCLARIMPRPLSEDLGRVKTGALPGVAALKSATGAAVSYSYHDEFLSPGLDEARLSTLRTWPGKAGVYATQWKTLAPVGSDFALGQRRRIMDRALTVAHAAMVEYANETIRVSKTTGFIDERDALHIEADVAAKLNAALGDDVSGVSFVIVRDVNVLATSLLKYRVRIIPVGYAKYIEGEFGFLNPANIQLAA